LIVGLAALVASAPAHADEADDQYAVAAGHYARRQWQLAAEAFQSYLDAYPNHGKADQGLFFLAEALLETGRWDQAGASFREYLRRYPEGKRAQTALFRAGEAAYLADELEQAKPQLERFLTRYPDDNLNSYVLAYLGNIALAEEDAAGAEAHFRRGLSQFPQGSMQDDCRFGLARALEQQGRHREAERLYLAVAAKSGSPLADDAQFHLGALQYGLGDFEEAIAAFDAFQSRWSDSPWRPTALLGRGWALLKLDRPAEAEAVFRQITSDPKIGTEACYWLGMAQKARQDWQNAAATLLEAAAADPQHKLAPALRLHAGDCLLRAGKTAAACEQFDLVIDSGPPENEWIDDAMRGKVQAALQAQDHQALDRRAEQFFRRFPDSPLSGDVRRMFAQSLIEQKQYARAEQVLKPLAAAEDGQQDDPEVQYLLSLAYAGLERHEDALAALLPVLDTADGQLLADARLAQASLLVKSKQFEEAIWPLEALLAGQPTGDTALKAQAQLAICCARTGRLDRAKHLYSELREKHPRHELTAAATEQLAEAAYDAGDTAWSNRLFAWLSTQSGSPAHELRGLSGLAWSQWKAGRLNEAAVTFYRLLSKHPDDPLAVEAALARGQILQQLGRPGPALAMYDLVIDRFADTEQYTEALWAAARLRDDLQMDEEAAALYETLVNAHPEFPQIDAALYQWAWALDDLGRVDESNKQFDRLHREHPGSRYWSDATFRLAQRAFEAGDCVRSKELVTAVLAGKPTAVIRENALYLSGQIAVAEAKWDEARRCFETLVTDYPEGPLRLMADYGVAETVFRQGDYEAAGERLERLVRESRGSTERWLAVVHLRLAQALAHQKKWSDALAVASEIEVKYPGFAEQHEVDYVIGRCLASRADFQAARDAYRKVIRSPGGAKTETAANAQLMIAESFFHQEDYETALREYLRLEILYDYPELQAAALLQAAKCRELLGQRPRAVELYERLLETYPQTDFATEAAERLRAARKRPAVGSTS